MTKQELSANKQKLKNKMEIIKLKNVIIEKLKKIIGWA